jgi:hypothetical protein
MSSNQKKRIVSKNQQEDTDDETNKCIGITRKNKLCGLATTGDNLFCDTYHEELQSYTQQQIEAYKQSTSECRRCHNIRLIEPNNEYCVTCENNNPICEGKTITGARCQRRTTTNLKYCVQYHNELNNYDADQLKSMKKCADCRRPKAFNKGDTYCLDCTEKAKNKTTPKTKSQIDAMVEKTKKEPTTCNAITKTGRKCTLVCANDSYYCDLHKIWDDYTDADILRCKKCLNCELYAPIDQESGKWCDVCYERSKNNRCTGLNKLGAQCSCNREQGKIFCKTQHSDMNDYTDEQLKNISCCPKCKRFRYVIDGKRCTVCKSEKDAKITCIGITEKKTRCGFKPIDDKRTCSYHAYMEDYTDTMMQKLRFCKNIPCRQWKVFTGKYCDECMVLKTDKYCIGLMYDGSECRNKRTDNNKTCNDHVDLCDYDEFMLENMTLCSTGKHYRYCGDFDTCVKCRDRGKSNRNKNKLDREKLEMCLKCGSHPRKFGDYCGVHEYLAKLQDAKSKGQRKCCVTRCNNIIILGSKNTRCDRCIAKFKMEYSKSKNILAQMRTQIDEYRDKNNWSASMCEVCKDIKYIAEFLLPSRICNTETGDLEDAYSYKCITCRKKINEKDKTLERPNKNHITNEYIIQNTYIRNCQIHRRHKNWDLGMEEAIRLIQQKCRYCGTYKSDVNDDGITYSCMGIDRVDNKKGYELGNCVSCCSLCNYFKYTYTPTDFLRYCRFIHENFGTMEQRNRKIKTAGYNKYVIWAKNRGKQFRITKTDFTKITSMKCFYCADKNDSGQIGIDRVFSDRGYCLDTNDLVSACAVCNNMKKDYGIKTFYDHILKILNYNMYETHSDFYGRFSPKWNNERKEIESIITTLQDIVPTKNIPECDRRSQKCMFSDSYYIDKIWRSYDVTQIDPLLIFCDTTHLKDLWKYYRNITSSIKRHHSPGFRNVKILVQDRYTGKYLGLLELSSSVWNCKALDDYLGWDIEQKKLKLNNIINITTCVPLQPFGYNFSAGKLLVMLVFTKEVFQYYKTKYESPIYGIVTYSLKESSIQYENLDEIKKIGNTPGFNSSELHDDNNTSIKIKNALKKWGLKTEKNPLYNVQSFCKYVGIDKTINEGTPRGIYFGFTGDKSESFLTTRQRDTEFNHNLKSICHMAKTWMVKYALPRFSDLTNRKSVLFHHNYNYYQYYVTDHGKDINRKKNDNISDITTATKYNKYSCEEIQEIIKIWYENKQTTYTHISQMTKDVLLKHIDPRFIKRIIYGDTDTNIDKKTKDIINMQQTIIEKKYDDHVKTKETNHFNTMIGSDQIKANYHKIKHGMRLYADSDDIFKVNVRKKNMYVYVYERNKTIMGPGCNKFINSKFSLNGIKQGEWHVTKSHLLRSDTILEMHHNANDNNNDKREAQTEFIIDNNDHSIPFLALYQTLQNDMIFIDDDKIYSNPHTITKKGNIFIRNNPNTLKIKMSTYLDDNGHIDKIKIKYMETRPPDSIDHRDCKCEFKGTYPIKR